jgi:DNA-binding MarR family transcriptional regulator
VKARDFQRKLTESKQASVLEPLFRTARLTNELALARMNARRPDGIKIRAAHTALLPHIDFDGTRLTTLAQRLGVTKQAVAPLVDELEAMGTVARISDPADGRAKLVVFTEEGRRGLLDGLALLKELEDEMAQAVGATRMKEFGRTLQKLLAFVDERLPPEGEVPGADYPRSCS